MNLTVLALALVLTCLRFAGVQIPGWVIVGAWAIGLLFNTVLVLLVIGVMWWILTQTKARPGRGP